VAQRKRALGGKTDRGEKKKGEEISFCKGGGSKGMKKIRKTRPGHKEGLKKTMALKKRGPSTRTWGGLMTACTLTKRETTGPETLKDSSP